MKLSQVKMRDVILKASKDDIEEIVFEKVNTKIDKPCDVGVIFGGISMIPYRVDRGIELYKEELINKILVTGGIGVFNKDRTTSEAYKMRDYLIKNGIPDSDIIVESSSKDSYQNIKNSMKILKELYNIDETTFALITSDFHLRRCLGLFEKVLGSNSNIYGSGVKDGKTDIESWKNSLYGQRIMLTEIILLTTYVRQNRIPDIDIKELSYTMR